MVHRLVIYYRFSQAFFFSGAISTSNLSYPTLIALSTAFCVADPEVKSTTSEARGSD